MFEMVQILLSPGAIETFPFAAHAPPIAIV
jgi:hypothetical protein